MTKMFVLVEGGYDSFEVIGAFTTRELAERFDSFHKCSSSADTWIEECDVDPGPDTTSGWWEIRIDDDFRPWNPSRSWHDGAFCVLKTSRDGDYWWNCNVLASSPGEAAIEAMKLVSKYIEENPKITVYDSFDTEFSTDGPMDEVVDGPLELTEVSGMSSDYCVVRLFRGEAGNMTEVVQIAANGAFHNYGGMKGWIHFPENHKLRITTTVGCHVKLSFAKKREVSLR